MALSELPTTEPLTPQDPDPVETREWLKSIDSVLKMHGADRAHFLRERLSDHTHRSGDYLPFKPNTACVNTLPTGGELEYPGHYLEIYAAFLGRTSSGTGDRPPERVDDPPAKVCDAIECEDIRALR